MALSQVLLLKLELVGILLPPNPILLSLSHPIYPLWIEVISVADMCYPWVFMAHWEHAISYNVVLPIVASSLNGLPSIRILNTRILNTRRHRLRLVVLLAAFSQSHSYTRSYHESASTPTCTYHSHLFLSHV